MNFTFYHIQSPPPPKLQPCRLTAFWDAFDWHPSLTWMGHHLSGVCFGLLQSRNPALTLPLWIRLQVVAPPPTRQHKVTGVTHLYVHRRQGNRASAGVCHFCLSPTDKFTYTHGFKKHRSTASQTSGDAQNPPAVLSIVNAHFLCKYLWVNL